MAFDKAVFRLIFCTLRGFRVSYFLSFCHLPAPGTNINHDVFVDGKSLTKVLEDYQIDITGSTRGFYRDIQKGNQSERHIFLTTKRHTVTDVSDTVEEKYSHNYRNAIRVHDKSDILKVGSVIVQLDAVYPDSIFDYILDYFELRYDRIHRFFHSIDDSRWTSKFAHDKMEALESACWVVHDEKTTTQIVLNYTNIHVKTVIESTEIECNFSGVKTTGNISNYGELYARGFEESKPILFETLRSKYFKGKRFSFVNGLYLSVYGKESMGKLLPNCTFHPLTYTHKVNSTLMDQNLLGNAFLFTNCAYEYIQSKVRVNTLTLQYGNKADQTFNNTIYNRTLRVLEELQSSSCVNVKPKISDFLGGIIPIENYKSFEFNVSNLLFEVNLQ